MRGENYPYLERAKFIVTDGDYLFSGARAFRGLKDCVPVHHPLFSLADPLCDAGPLFCFAAPVQDGRSIRLDIAGIPAFRN